MISSTYHSTANNKADVLSFTTLIMNNKPKNPEKKPFDRIAYNKEYQKQYRKKNSEKSKAYQEEYHKNNSEKIKTYRKQYREANQDKIKKHRKENAEKEKAYQKEYRKKLQQLKLKKETDPNKKPFNKKEYFKQYQKNNAEKIKQKKLQYRLLNKEKIKESRKKNYYNNIDICRQRSRNYRDCNKEKCSLRDKKYREEKKEELKINKRKYVKKRRNEDILFKIISSLRSRLRSVMKYKNTKKCKKTLELTGCTLEFLYNYLETKFTKGMSWNNYGKFGWHIDHIIPCSSFDMSNPEEQKKCFHYTNLQPLWWLDNLKKSNKIL